MKTEELEYSLPIELIATEPVEPRDAVKLTKTKL
ncbi:S-adenosylmethionine:tRNA ribosyltransferase-isomerase [Patescibacteria group bacterium]|nr:S-adenosylmethionine:tRNA ribosyltransferase-isomerase [Patescibacteria group bacterium]